MKILAILSLLVGFSAIADTYFIKKPHKVVGISKDETETIDELIATGLENQKQQVVENEASAKYVLNLKYIKLGKAVIINADKSQGGKDVYSTQMKAEKTEELDNVTSRITRSIVFDGRPDQQEATVKDVTENEAIQGTRRKDTVNRWYFGMGPTWVDKVNASRGVFNLAIGYYWEIDPMWALKIVYDGSAGNFNYVALGTNYYFSDHKQSPLVTAELGWGGASTDDSVTVKSESINGWVIGAGAGYQFFRTSKVNLEILAHAAVMTESNHLGNPAKYGIRVGIYW
jgi:hypothetical protein